MGGGIFGKKNLKSLCHTVTPPHFYFQMTDYLQISMELGCFLAGVMISGQGPAVSEQIEHTVQPVKDFLGCIFFCSIGKHLYIRYVVKIVEI